MAAMGVRVESQVTGRVLRVEKRVGEAVNEEDVLLILESMKMEIPLEAPCQGTVAEIRVAEGDQVTEGDIVVLLD
jgi:acetyl-CoA carboxylase biotin carboxyl carrier protein